MTPGQRRWVFLAAMAALAAFYLWGLTGLPGFGNYPGPYGNIINRVAVPQTNATGVVSAVNFEYRGFDTLGEEFILFIAATGVSLVLRQLRGEREGPARDEALDRRVPATTDAVRMACLVMVGPTVVMGWYLASHAQTSPSGGFQGGVLLATAFILIYLAGQFLVFERFSPVRHHRRRRGGGSGRLRRDRHQRDGYGPGLPHELSPAGFRRRRRELVRHHRADQLLRGR